MMAPDESKTAQTGDRSGPRVVVVVPTYNEAENLPELARRIFAQDLPNPSVLVVDDGSPDGTAEVASGLGDRVSVMQRGSKQGLGSAYVAGFKHALEAGADYVVQMDADLSHAPEYLPDFLKSLEDADVVVGSRYVRGGRVSDDWGLARRALSWLGNYGIRMVAGLRVRDATSGFKAYRRSMLCDLKLEEFRCKGFAFQAEVAHACQSRGARVSEYPIIFHDRERGSSKMSMSIVVEAVWKLLPLRLGRR